MATTPTETHGGNSGLRATGMAGRPVSWLRPERVGPRDRAGSVRLAEAPGRPASGRPADRRGQHTAERSYSIATVGGRPVAITVERLDERRGVALPDRELPAGDQLELRGPIGRWFVWDTGDGGPLLLIGGGSGAVPLRAILRHGRRRDGGRDRLAGQPASVTAVTRDCPQTAR